MMKMNNSIEEWERRAALLAILPWEKKLEELRYNPYHDPNNGRFTSGNYSGKTFMPDIRKRYSDGGSKPIDKTEKSDIIKSSEDFSYISATGPNEFEKGFSKTNLANHWYGNDAPIIHSHKSEYEKRGYDMKGYSELALDLIQKPVGNNILGFKTDDGFVIRYDTVTGDFVKGNPKKGIKTMFVASQSYYERRKPKGKEK